MTVLVAAIRVFVWAGKTCADIDGAGVDGRGIALFAVTEFVSSVVVLDDEESSRTINGFAVGCNTAGN